MYSYIQWFLAGFDSVLSPAEISDCYSCLAVTIPVVLTIAGVVMLIWAIMGVFRR